MIFSHQGQTCLFIHVPKTGGNSIQSFIIGAGLSSDQKISGGSRDGIDRFEIRGELTQGKHQTLSTYLRISPQLRQCKIYSVVRKPFERLVSFYFSPNRNIVLDEDSGRYVFRSNPYFVEADFLALVRNTNPAFQYLLPRKPPLTTKAAKAFPSLSECFRTELKSLYVSSVSSLRLQVFQTESLASQFEQAFGFKLPESRRNVSPFRNQAKQVLESKELRRFVEIETLHGLDLDLFYP